MKKTFSVLAIGYGKNIFVDDHSERKRMEACAQAVVALHMVVFTRKKDDLKPTHKNGLFLYPTNASSKIGMLWQAIKIGRKIIKNQPGPFIVTAQDPFDAGLVGYVISRLTDSPLNLQEHGDFLSLPYWSRESLFNRVRLFWGRQLLKRASTVRVVASRIEKTLIQSGVDATKIRILPVVTESKLFKESQAMASIRSSFAEGSFIFLTVARLVPQKNLFLLLNSFKEAHRQCPNLKLMIVGQGSLHAELIGLARDLFGEAWETVVKILPWSSEVPTLMKSVDAYVLSSNYEGWGRVLIEAKLSALPIVTTDVGCVGEEVINGRDAIVVPVADPVALSNAMVEMATNKSLRDKIISNLQADDLISVIEIPFYATAWVDTLE